MSSKNPGPAHLGRGTLPSVYMPILAGYDKTGPFVTIYARAVKRTNVASRGPREKAPPAATPSFGASPLGKRPLADDGDDIGRCPGRDSFGDDRNTVYGDGPGQPRAAQLSADDPARYASHPHREGRGGRGVLKPTLDDL